MLRGKNIGRYFIEFGGDYLWYKPELITQKPGGRPRILAHYLKPKIVIQDIAKSINASIDLSNYLVNDTINVIHEINDDKPIQYILGLLNSKLINRWFSTTFPEGFVITSYSIHYTKLYERLLPASRRLAQGKRSSTRNFGVAAMRFSSSAST